MVECTGGNGSAYKHEKSGQVKNVIFDLGNVLISFKPAEFLDARNYTSRLKSKILTDIFASEEWLLLDNGDITTRQAIDNIAGKSSLRKDQISEIFNQRNEILYPITSNLKILPDLKKHGFRLFYLSNFPADMWDHVSGLRNGEYSFFSYFDGGLISAEAHCSKPDPLFYSRLIEKYHLNPGECLFIDDLEVNTKASTDIGMNALVTFGSEEIYDDVKRALGI